MGELAQLERQPLRTATVSGPSRRRCGSAKTPPWLEPAHRARRDSLRVGLGSTASTSEADIDHRRGHPTTHGCMCRRRVRNGEAFLPRPYRSPSPATDTPGSAFGSSPSDQFYRAQGECADPAKPSSWLPMLSQFGPSLLVRCEYALAMSWELIRGCLANHLCAKSRLMAMPERGELPHRLPTKRNSRAIAITCRGDGRIGILCPPVRERQRRRYPMTTRRDFRLTPPWVTSDPTRGTSTIRSRCPPVPISRVARSLPLPPGRLMWGTGARGD